MAQPNSGDDYYAKIEPSTTQAGTGAEKKKIKIVAKKAAPASVPEKAETPEPERPAKLHEITEQEEASAPAPRAVKLPEGGKLELGTKFVSRPAVVFHTHPRPSVGDQSRPLGQRPFSGGGSAGLGQRSGSASGRPGQPSFAQSR